jgi:DNA-binding GntR family transcriptional regulator
VMDHGRGEDIPGVSVVGRIAWAFRGHWRIARALRRRDADTAERAMRQHLLWAKRLHLSLFDWRRRQKPVPVASGEIQDFPGADELACP